MDINFKYLVFDSLLKVKDKKCRRDVTFCLFFIK